MRFAKPPEGFTPVCRPQTVDMVERLCAGDEECLQYKNDVVELLRKTGHRVGVDLDWPGLPGARAYVAERLPSKNMQGMQVWVVYRIKGSEIVFHRIRVEKGLRAID
jgi:hypothetical protein